MARTDKMTPTFFARGTRSRIVLACPLGALLLLLAAGGAARAGRTPIVIAPLAELGISRAETTKVRRWLQAAVSSVRDFRLLSTARVARFMRRQEKHRKIRETIAIFDA